MNSNILSSRDLQSYIFYNLRSPISHSDKVTGWWPYWEANVLAPTGQFRFIRRTEHASFPQRLNPIRRVKIIEKLLEVSRSLNGCYCLADNFRAGHQVHLP